MSDLISRSALYKDIERRPYINKALAEIFETIIDDQPEVEAVPVVHGKWIIGDDDMDYWKCSECGFEVCPADSIYTPYEMEINYCQKCGASMKKGE